MEKTKKLKNFDKKKQRRRRKQKGITLIALVITIIVLLILARSKYSNINRRKWDTDESKPSNGRYQTRRK